MTSPAPAATLFAVAVVAVVLGALLVPPIARRSGRPPFVVGLCLAAAAMVVAELVLLVLSPVESVSTFLLGMRLEGGPAGMAILVQAAVQIMIAVGLWLLRPWARLAAMGYLGFLLASFLLWGLGSGHGREPVYVLVWQLCVLPFLTFSFMYLYRGAHYFVAAEPVRPESRA